MQNFKSNMMSPKISFNTDTAPYIPANSGEFTRSYTVYLMQTTEGGTVGFLELNFELDICGYEEITWGGPYFTADVLEQHLYINKNEYPLGFHTINFKDFVSSNDSDCPLQTFTLVDSNNQPVSGDTASAHSVVSTSIWKIITQESSLGNYTFRAQISTVWGSSTIRFPIHTKIDFFCDPSAAQITASGGAVTKTLAKNGGVKVVLTEAEVLGLFTLTDTNPLHCPIYTLQVQWASNGVAIPSSDPAYNKFRLSEFDGLDAFPPITADLSLNFNTDLTFSSSEDYPA